jgi:exodeoxyribonuclease VII large subunit
VDVTIADLVADVRAATPTAAAELAVPDAREVLRLLADAQVRLTRCLEERLASASAELGGILRSVVFRDPTWRLRGVFQLLEEFSHRLRADVGHLVSDIRRRLEPAAGRLAAMHPANLAQRSQGGLERLIGRLAWSLGGRSKCAGDAIASLRARLLAATPAHRVALLSQRVVAAGRQLEAMSYRSVLRRGFSVTRTDDGVILRGVATIRSGERITTELADGKVASRIEDAIAPDQSGKPFEPARKASRGGSGARTDKPMLFDREQ